MCSSVRQVLSTPLSWLQMPGLQSGTTTHRWLLEQEVLISSSSPFLIYYNCFCFDNGVSSFLVLMCFEFVFELVGYSLKMKLFADLRQILFSFFCGVSIFSSVHHLVLIRHYKFFLGCQVLYLCGILSFKLLLVYSLFHEVSKKFWEFVLITGGFLC